MTIYIKIFAGLCNRLFQYSYGKYLMSQGKKVKFIVADDGNTDILDVMNLGSDEKLFYTNQTHSKLKVNFLKSFTKYITKNYKVGFFQEPKFAQSVNFQFKNILEYQSSNLVNKIKDTNSVSLHIRGGDYLNPGEGNPFINICTKEYYINAIKLIQQKISSPTFFIFTNDINYAKSIANQFDSNCKFIFVDELKEKKYDDGFDLFLMSLCKANIIANSTFSWWGAYLNKTPHTVICPTHWTNKEPYNHDILILDDWEKI